MKGQVMELMDIFILVVGVTILLMISYFIFSRGTEVKVFTAKRERYEKMGMVTTLMFYTKLPFIEKTFSQVIGDVIISQNQESIYYGNAYGFINGTQVIYDVLTKYFQNKWKFEVSYEDKQLTYGYEPKTSNVVVMNFKIPIPGHVGGVANARLTIW